MLCPSEAVLPSLYRHPAQAVLILREASWVATLSQLNATSPETMNPIGTFSLGKSHTKIIFIISSTSAAHSIFPTITMEGSPDSIVAM